MLHRKRLIISVPAMLLIMACAALMPSTSVATITPTDAATAISIFTPSVTSLPTSSPSPSVSIPVFDSFQPVTRIHLDSSERVLNMLADADDTIWLVTDRRVLQYSRDIWTDYLPSFSGTIIGMDSNHRVWVVSDDRAQVSAWDGSTWTNLGAETGWEPPTSDEGVMLHWSLATDASGQVWLSTNRDVRMFDGTRWKVFSLADLGMPIPEDEDTRPETALFFLESSGYIWANNCHWIGPGPFGGGGARWYDGHGWQGADSPVAHGCATVVDEDGLGNIWLGLDNNLWRFDTTAGNWEQYPAPEPPESGWFGFFSDLAVDAAGTPWPELTRCGGASCYTGNVRYHFTGTEWLQIGDIGTDSSSLYFDATGRGWVFAPYGVSRIGENQLEPVAELSFLKAAVTPLGKLWVLGVYKGETVLWVQSLNG